MRTLAPDVNLSSSETPDFLDRNAASSSRVPGGVKDISVEADRRPAGPLQHPSQVQQAIEPSALMFSAYQRTYMNIWLRAIGREDLILHLEPAAAGEVAQ